MCTVIQKVVCFVNKMQFTRKFIFTIVCCYYKD